MLVVGAGYSAATSLLALVELRARAPATEVVWAVRSAVPRLLGKGEDHELPARGRLAADVVVAATGFRPDLGIGRELRLGIDPALESTAALAPLIDPNVHSCETVPPHGAAELAHPEPGWFTVGSKSYGRAPTFLLATGYEQVRSVVAQLAGDHAAAGEVRLELPTSGVCDADLATQSCG